MLARYVCFIGTFSVRGGFVIGQRCDVSSEIREEFYNAETKTWTVDTALLDAVNDELQRIVNCATSETISFAEGVVYYAPTTIVITQPVRIEGTSSSDESRPTWTCTENNHQILVIQDVEDVVLEGIHFFNCTPAEDTRSTVAVNNSRVEIADCLFERNGRALSVHGNSVIALERSEFLNNDEGAVQFAGASRGRLSEVNFTENGRRALSAHGNSVITLERSEFLSNNGGAIHVAGATRGRLLQVNFTGNRAFSSGSALLLTDDVHVDADEVIFENNNILSFASGKGGAVSLYSTRGARNVPIDTTRPGIAFKLKNSVCRGNSAVLGGCIYADGNARLEVTDSLIFNNSVRFQAGTRGRFHYGGWRANLLRLPGEVFTGNGGGIYARQIHSVVLTRVSFTQNSAPGKGGGLYMEAQELTNNLTLCRSQLVLDECTFDRNEATYGGGLHLQDYTVAFLDRTQFIRNSATVSGGGVSLQAQGYDKRASCKNNTVSLRYEVTAVDRLPYIAGRPNRRFPYEYFNPDGEPFKYLGPTVALMMHGVHFESNEAVKFGGALFGEQGVFAFAGESAFAQNSAGESGAVYFKYGMFYANGGAFHDNTSPVSGGAITINGEPNRDSYPHLQNRLDGATGSWRCEGYVQNTVFAGNAAKDYGGAVFVFGNNGIFFGARNLTFENNGARSGGAVMSSNAARLLIDSSVFTRNRASAGGGAIAFGALQVSQNTLVVSGSEFVQNRAARGGAIYTELLRLTAGSESVPTRDDVHGATTISVSGVVCTDNAAEKDGGALYARGARLSFSGRATGNSAGRRGGALCYVAGSVATVLGSLEQNKAEDGGAISITQFAKARCAACNISENSAINSGGAVAIDADLNDDMPLVFQCDGCAIKNNAARFGGGIRMQYVGPDTLADEALMVLRDTNLTGNVASVNGGGIETAHPENVYLNCTSGLELSSRHGRDAGDFLMVEEIEGLGRLSEGICPSWQGNVVTTSDPAP